MPDLRRRNCRSCRKNDAEVGPISWRGLCRTCAVAHVDENIEQMTHRTGPNWSKWRHGMAACVGGSLVDDRDEAA